MYPDEYSTGWSDTNPKGPDAGPRPSAHPAPWSQTADKAVLHCGHPLAPHAHTNPETNLSATVFEVDVSTCPRFYGRYDTTSCFLATEETWVSRFVLPTVRSSVGRRWLLPAAASKSCSLPQLRTYWYHGETGTCRVVGLAEPSRVIRALFALLGTLAAGLHGWGHLAVENAALRQQHRNAWPNRPLEGLPAEPSRGIAAMDFFSVPTIHSTCCTFWSWLITHGGEPSIFDVTRTPGSDWVAQQLRDPIRSGPEVPSLRPRRQVLREHRSAGRVLGAKPTRTYRPKPMAQRALRAMGRVRTARAVGLRGTVRGSTSMGSCVHTLNTIIGPDAHRTEQGLSVSERRWFSAERWCQGRSAASCWWPPQSLRMAKGGLDCILANDSTIFSQDLTTKLAATIQAPPIRAPV